MANEAPIPPVDFGISEGKSLGFAPTAVAGPVDAPVGGLNNPISVAQQTVSPPSTSAPGTDGASDNASGAS